jgi:hypothetical protein
MISRIHRCKALKYGEPTDIFTYISGVYIWHINIGSSYSDMGCSLFSLCSKFSTKNKYYFCDVKGLDCVQNISCGVWFRKIT